MHRSNPTKRPECSIKRQWLLDFSTALPSEVVGPRYGVQNGIEANSFD
jgi:hypothetical protein